MATKKETSKVESVALVTKGGINVTVGSDVVDKYLKRGYKTPEDYDAANAPQTDEPTPPAPPKK